VWRVRQRRPRRQVAFPRDGLASSSCRHVGLPPAVDPPSGPFHPHDATPECGGRGRPSPPGRQAQCRPTSGRWCALSRSSPGRKTVHHHSVLERPRLGHVEQLKHRSVGDGPARGVGIEHDTGLRLCAEPEKSRGDFVLSTPCPGLSSTIPGGNPREAQDDRGRALAASSPSSESRSTNGLHWPPTTSARASSTKRWSRPAERTTRPPVVVVVLPRCRDRRGVTRFSGAEPRQFLEGSPGTGVAAIDLDEPRQTENRRAPGLTSRAQVRPCLTRPGEECLGMADVWKREERGTGAGIDSSPGPHSRPSCRSTERLSIAL